MVPTVTVPKKMPIVSPAPVLGSAVTAGVTGGGVGGAAAGMTGEAVVVQAGAVIG